MKTPNRGEWDQMNAIENKNYCAIPIQGFENRLFLADAKSLDAVKIFDQIAFEAKTTNVKTLLREKKMQKLIIKPRLTGMSICFYDEKIANLLSYTVSITQAIVNQELYYLNSKSLASFIVRLSKFKTFEEIHKKYEEENLHEDLESKRLSEMILTYLTKTQTSSPRDIWEIIQDGFTLLENLSIIKEETKEQSFARMIKNASKAYEEHKRFFENDSFLGAWEARTLSKKTTLSLDKINERLENPIKLSFSHSIAIAQGKRESMEDAHFFAQTPEGLLMGIFDGHGGAEVANFAAKNWTKTFLKFLHESDSNPYSAFINTANHLQAEILSKPGWKYQGSTALVCFINSAGLIFTATIGDSEAKIYHKNLWVTLSYPLSCVRSWSSPREARRAAEALNQPEIAEKWPKRHSKMLRFPYRDSGVNVSRALGDHFCSKINEKPGVIHKPKITVSEINPGDILVLGCDGLWDFVVESQMIKLVEEVPIEDLAKHLVNFALECAQSTDNITVMAFKF